MTIFVHPAGICESTHVGEGTKVWAFAHVLSGAQIGRDCNICDGVFIENDVIVGNSVTIKSGVQLWNGVRLGDRVFVGPNATFTNDRFPRSKHPPATFLQTVVDDDVSIGANATILPGVHLGFGAMIGAGAVIVSDVPARSVVVGNPGRVVGYAGAQELKHLSLPKNSGPRLVRLQNQVDARGRLVVADGANIPFTPKRVFLVDQVAAGAARGGHAHRACHQLMIVAAGKIDVAVDDGGKSAFVVHVDDLQFALYVPPMVWSMQFGHSNDAVLMVLASEPYDPDDYINDYKEFQDLAHHIVGHTL
jgi:UDP-2-acetamido-3-amino-2,3-dideoxy-glucuronate N-acetyltransferase